MVMPVWRPSPNPLSNGASIGDPAGIGVTVLNENLVFMPGNGLLFDNGLEGLFGAGSGILEQRNGTNPQTLRVYNTYTDVNNFERLSFLWSGNNAFIQTQAGGTGVPRDFTIGSQAASSLIIATNNIQRWYFPSTGHIFAITDNTYDIGASGANRPRNIFIGSVMIVGGAQINMGNTLNLWAGVGAPTAGQGSNGDYFFRQDTPGTANQRIYVKSAGAWVGIV